MGAFWQTVRLLFNRSSREKVGQLLEQAQKEGVDVEDAEKRKEWIRSHRPEVRAGLKSSGMESVGRITVGRNVPCPCGSGKKFKKCCGS